MRSLVIALGALLIAACCSSGSSADDVRRPNVPEAARGTWAPGTELCSEQQKTLTISEKTYTDAQSACEVRWVEVRAGTPGTIYSARMVCRKTAEAADLPKLTNLVLWLKESGRASIGPTLDALKPYNRCP